MRLSAFKISNDWHEAFRLFRSFSANIFNVFYLPQTFQSLPVQFIGSSTWKSCETIKYEQYYKNLTSNKNERARETEIETRDCRTHMHARTHAPKPYQFKHMHRFHTNNFATQIVSALSLGTVSHLSFTLISIFLFFFILFHSN